MNEDLKFQQAREAEPNDEALMDRRDFLLSLKKWSKVAIAGAVVGGAIWTLDGERGAEAAAWANRARGGAWANRAGGGGAWANRGGAWANRGTAWANRGGAWVNRF